KNLTEFKVFIYTLKNFNNNSLMSFQQLNDIIEFIKYQDSEDILKDILLNYNEIISLSKKNPVELLNLINNYFCSLKNKLNKYGDFFITAPSKSDLLQTNLDYYDSSYTCLASSFSIFLNSNYYLHTPNNPLSLFITNNSFKNYNSNYKFYNNVRHVICKYNSSKHYCMGFNKKNSLTDNL